MVQRSEHAQFEENLLAMNEALLLGSLRQHELVESTEVLNAELRREIAERTRTQALLSIQKQAFEMLALETPLLDVLRYLACSVEDHSPQKVLVAFHLLDGSFSRFEHTVAPHLPAEYAKAVNGMEVASAIGCCCASVTQRRRVVIADIAANEEWPVFASFALPLGLRAAWSSPIFSATGKVLGTFVSYCREVCEPDPRGDLFSEIVVRTASICIERAHEEQALRDSEERFRALFDLGPIGVYSCDAAGKIQEFNRRAAEIWGRTPALNDANERFCGSFKLFQPDGTLIPPEHCPMAQVLAGIIPEALDVEVIVERPDGSRASGVVNVRPLKTPQGEITGAINCFYDITERKHNEAAVRASEAQYRTLFNSIDEGFCIIEKLPDRPGELPDFRYLEANPAFERISGASNAIGQTIRQAFPGEPNEWINTYARILDDGKPVRFERELVTKGRILELYAFRLEDEGQQRLAIIFQDISDRKQAEELAQRLAAIVQSSEDAILSTDKNGMITSWNRGAEYLLGYSASEVMGKSYAMLVPPDRHNEELEILERIRGGQHVDHSETSRLHKDGTEVWVSLSASPLRNADGEIIGASKIVRDITLRRLSDEHRSILVSELNHRAKNLLAIVRAIAAQTIKGATSLEDAQTTFESRLGALVRGHDLLTSGNWAGTDLASVAKATVEPHRDRENRFRIEGPLVPLTPATALTFTMALHELCTNALKYGALSVETGNVSIVWEITGGDAKDRLHLQWKETGGPAVAPPSHKGFGSRLVERALAMELFGEVRIDYEPIGVVCTIDAPLPRSK